MQSITIRMLLSNLLTILKLPMRDQKYFIGVQLDGSKHVEPLQNSIPEATAKENSKLVRETVENIDEAVRELPYANSTPEDLWKNHSKVVQPKPHGFLFNSVYLRDCREPAQTGGIADAGAQNNMGLDMLMNMFSGLGASGLNVPPTPNLPPEELYATQLSQFQEMGFFDTQENIRALHATSGNVHEAVERLLGNLGTGH
ncbi:uncharacterized protein LOC141659362 isoform X1 [Apium graveolens]|uniref:uncharacterized protein LOC141659362 isoform X1 n=2 Tax=Apium graveolens TaxID=4045 RepID=UPI003D7BE618